MYPEPGSIILWERQDGRRFYLVVRSGNAEQFSISAWSPLEPTVQYPRGWHRYTGGAGVFRPRTEIKEVVTSPEVLASYLAWYMLTETHHD
jgi:hypothetical protein